MFNNYFYLKRAVIELNQSLKNCKLLDVFSQEKDKAVFVFEENGNEKYLLFNTTSNQPFILLRGRYSKAKKNTFTFFDELKYKSFYNISIAETDRIIKMEFQNYSVYFTLRGAKTNLFLFDDNNFVESFKKVNDENLEVIQKDLLSSNYINLFSTVSTSIENFSKNELKSQFPFLNNILLNEIKIRFEESKSLNQSLNEIFYEVISGDISVGYLESKLRFLPDNYFISQELSETKLFENYFEALNYFLTSNYKKEKVDDVFKVINNELEKKLSFLSNKINNLEQRVNTGSREKEYYKIGNLLLSNLHHITKEEDSINLYDYETDSEINIKIDKKLSPSENANKYFDKAKDEKKNYQVSLKLYENSKEEYFRQLKIKKKLEQTDSFDELKIIKDQLKIKDKAAPKMNKEEINIKYYHYVVEEKYHVYVGRDSKSNDLLTLKFAKQNDLWFHARGLPGSHVVLRIENTKEVVPKNIIKIAASIAAFHSKAKTAGTVPVSYTFKKFVIKKKGMEPGKVLLMKESSILVKPEIPSNVILESDE